MIVMIKTRHNEGSMLLKVFAIEKDDRHANMLKFTKETNVLVQCLHQGTPDVAFLLIGK